MKIMKSEYGHEKRVVTGVGGRRRWHTTVSTDPRHSVRGGEIGITHSLIGVGEVGKGKKEGGLSSVGTRGRGKERKKKTEESQNNTLASIRPPPLCLHPGALRVPSRVVNSAAL